MRKVLFTLATGLFLFAGVPTSNACDGHKKVQKAATGAEAKVEKKECTPEEKKACDSKTAHKSSNGKSCCASKSQAKEAKTEAKPATGAKS